MDTTIMSQLSNAQFQMNQPQQIDPKTKQAAEEFEAVFLSQMMTHMWEGVPTDGMFGGGQGEAIYRSMMIQEHGKNMAQAGGIGIADHLMNLLIQAQETK